MRLLLRAISYFRDDLGQIILSLTLIVMTTVLGLLQPWPQAILIASVLQGQHRNRWIDNLFFRIVHTDNKMTQIICLAAITLLLLLAKELVQMFQTFISIRIGYNGLMRVRCELFRKLQALSMGYHRSQPQGDAIYRLSYDTFGFQTMLGVCTGVLLNVITLLSMTYIMLSMEWRLTLIALGVVPVLLFIFRRFKKVLEQKSTRAHEVDTELTTAIQRSVAAISLVQAFGKEAEEYARFHNTVRNSVNTWLKLHRNEVVYWLCIGMTLGTGGAMIFGFGGYLILKGTFDIGGLVVFIQYLASLYDPLNKLSGTGASIAGGVAGVKRVIEVLDRDPIISDAPDALPLPKQSRVFKLNDVMFEYRKGDPVLQGITTTISPGQMVAFVGESGVGKTTLLSLLPRFYDPTSGSLTLDGYDLRKVKIRDLRQHIAVVVQENVILPTSVAENIAYGRPTATDAQIAEAARLAGADSFIEKLPQKYETVISESGQNLSGGQRQRIAIARALLTEAPILVLDEPTSALDPQHEQMVTEMLRNLKRHRTIILVSHRLSTVADCDQIFVMESGRIAEQGTHDELVKQHGLYFQMAKHQMKLEDPAPAVVP